jgi:hypothetical protein
MEKCYIESRRRGIISHTIKEEKLPVLVTANVETAFCNTLLKER